MTLSYLARFATLAGLGAVLFAGFFDAETAAAISDYANQGDALTQPFASLFGVTEDPAVFSLAVANGVFWFTSWVGFALGRRYDGVTPNAEQRDATMGTTLFGVINLLLIASLIYAASLGLDEVITAMPDGDAVNESMRQPVTGADASRITVAVLGLSTLYNWGLKTSTTLKLTR